jgi:Ca2+-binding EF-hand superfamily protein
MIRMTTALMVAGLALGGGLLDAQERDRDRDRSEEDRTADDRSANSSDESWTDWFRNWWNEDQQSQRMQGQDQNPQNFGVAGFMKRRDEDGDGYLSRSELPKGMRDGFEQLDRDHDGYLSPGELRQHAERFASGQQQRRGQGRRTGHPVEIAYIWVLDADQGQVHLKDLQQAYALLRKIDQNDDGEISRSELRKRQQQVASQYIDHCFQKLDQNNDDEITRSEARDSALGQRFDQFDRNQDDVVTRSELKRSIQTASSQESDEDSDSRNSRSRFR